MLGVFGKQYFNAMFNTDHVVTGATETSVTIQCFDPMVAHKLSFDHMLCRAPSVSMSFGFMSSTGGLLSDRPQESYNC